MHALRSALVSLIVLLLSVGMPPALGAPARQDTVRVFVEPTAGLDPVLSLIHEARHSIRLEVYLLTSRTVVDALRRSARRGVEVRVLLEEHPYGGGQYARFGYQMLRAAGVAVRWANEGAFRFTHEKAMVVDGRTAGIFTFNLTSSGLSRNREFGVIDADVTDARTLGAVFDADWSRHGLRLASARLVISPYNARHALQRLIDSARHSLDLYAEEVADPSVENRLAAAERRHVRIRLITSDDSPGVEVLRRAGIAVTLMPSPYVHAKAIVADDSRLFIGSENISATSLDANREVGVVLNEKRLAEAVERTFSVDWRSNAGTSSARSSHPAPTAGTTSSGALRVTAQPSTVSRGQRLTIMARTNPGASCTIRVTYPDGYVSRARDLQGSRIADNTGTVSWSWHMGSTVTGTAHADVTCTLAGRTTTGSATFTIR